MKKLHGIMLGLALTGAIFTGKAQVSLYSFSQSVGTYTPLTGGTVLESGSFDDDHFTVTIPSFRYDGVDYTSMNVSLNGFVALGSVDPTVYHPISDGSTDPGGYIAPFGCDLRSALSGSPEVRWATVGNEVVVQWKDLRRYDANAAEVINFQLRLNTVTNGIRVMYGACTPGSDNTYPEVGLRGPSSTFPADVNNRSVLDVTGAWVGSVQGADEFATCYFEDVTPATVPASGTTFAWTAPVIPVDLAVSAISGLNSCLTATENVVITVKNNGTGTINFATTPCAITFSLGGAATATLSGTINTGTLAVNGTRSLTLTPGVNMSTGGVYTFTATATMTGDGLAGNNVHTGTANNMFPVAFTLPQTVNFTGYTYQDFTAFPGWFDAQGLPPTSVGSYWYDESDFGSVGNTSAVANLYYNDNREWIVGPKFMATANTKLTFDAALTDYDGLAYNFGSDDKVQVMVSTDCGATFAPVFTLDASSAMTPTFQNYSVLLNAYAGQYIEVAFFATDGTTNDPEDVYFHLDNININNNASAIDAGVSGLISSAISPCHTSNEMLVVQVKNFGTGNLTNIPVQAIIANGTTTQTLTGTFNSTIPSNVVGVAVLSGANLAGGGNYTITIKTQMPGDGDATNEAYVYHLSTPFLLTYENFENLPAPAALPIGWTIDGDSQYDFNTAMANGVNQGLNNSTAIAADLYNNNLSSYVYIAKVPVTAANQVLSFKYRITDYANQANPGGTATTLANEDSVLVEATTTCGNTFTQLLSINNTTHVTSNLFVEKSICLGTYVGDTIGIRLRGVTDGSGDWIIAFDSLIVGPAVANLNAPSADLCVAGGTVSVSGLPTGGVLSGPAALSGNVFDPSVAGVGSYTVSYAYCGATTTKTITVVTPSVTVAGPAAICAGTSATLTASGASTYSWSTGAATSSISVSPTGNTSYTVTGNYANCTAQAVSSVTVNASPTVSFSMPSPTVCVGSGAITLTATPTGGTFSGANVSGSTFTPSAAGNYTVTYSYTNSNNCSASAASTVSVSTCTGIDELSAASVSIYPNPMNASFNVQLQQSASSHYVIEVVDALGKLVIRQQLAAGETTINTTALENGIYFYTIFSNSTRITNGKLIKQ